MVNKSIPPNNKIIRKATISPKGVGEHAFVNLSLFMVYLVF